MERRKTLQELTIKDNFMFGAVMMDEDICKELLELILGFKISSVTVSREKSIVYRPEYKGIRLDVIAADEDRTHYNVEMQVRYKRNLGKRSRYYHSQIDMEMLQAGLEYDLLPDSYVIFICDFDPFSKKKYYYSFGNFCREEPGLSLNDGNHTIFLSTCGENEDEVPEGLVKFLKYVKSELGENGDYEDDFVMRVQEAVRNVKISREMGERYMLLEEFVKEEREEAKAEGKAEMLLEFLADLGEVPEELREKIESETNGNVLQTYLKKASKAESMDEFLDMIR